MSKFITKYGHFSDDGNEYIINTHLTPKPWVNVISNGDYGLVISQAGGGFSWLTHSEFENSKFQFDHSTEQKPLTEFEFL